MAEKSTPAILKEYFGYSDGETVSGFLQELKALTPEDKQQLADGIRNGTLTY